MNIQRLLTPKQLEVCQKEQNYYKHIGVSKSLPQIAMEHRFIKKKQKEAHNLELLKEYEFLIAKEDAQTLVIEVKNLLGKKTLAQLQQKVKKQIRQNVIPVREFDSRFAGIMDIDPAQIESSIKRFNAGQGDEVQIAQLFDQILSLGVKRQASDIHINAYEDFCWLRFRMQGSVQAKFVLSHELARRFSFIVKERCGLDLVNAQIPQSGSFQAEILKSPVDFRIEIAPAHFGENIVIRILSKDSGLKTLDTIFPRGHPMHEHINRFGMEKNGFFLVVGPTGSGKTTTLNALLTKRDRLHEISYTIEDPIEYKIDFITQYQINESLGFGFEEAMKSVMRQDPDVITIGEMRDKKSIQSALKAAHSGHMVFSTLHTSTAFMAMERIRDEGGDLFILAYSLSSVIAQRLVPKLCECKQKDEKNSGEFLESSQSGYKPKGCIKCDFSGYAGRVLLTDMVFIPPRIKTRYKLYMALKSSSVFEVWDEFITFSYLQSARYLFENGLCDYERLKLELLSLGYSDES